jgi:hypothetical protein
MKVADVLDALRSSDCSTAPFRLFVTPKDIRSIDNGYTEGGVAISLSAKTYTGAIMSIQNNETPLGVDPVADFRMCVWDYETKILRATTDNLAAELNAAPRKQAGPQPEGGHAITAQFLSPLSLREGEWVIVGNALYGTKECQSIAISSMNLHKRLMERSPQMGFNNKSSVTSIADGGTQYPTGGYEGGIPGPVGTDVSGNYPWMDLLDAED